jgi:hypothetical protein
MRLPDGNILAAHLSVLYSRLVRQLYIHKDFHGHCIGGAQVRGGVGGDKPAISTPPNRTSTVSRGLSCRYACGDTKGRIFLQASRLLSFNDLLKPATLIVSALVVVLIEHPGKVENCPAITARQSSVNLLNHFIDGQRVAKVVMGGIEQGGHGLL